MKRYGNLYPEIIDFENLLKAAKQAQKSKRYRDDVLAFNYNLESELLQLRQELKDCSYQPGNYRIFHIYEPKKRVIAAAPYRDRVVHHAICQVIVPIFERSFINTSYANRIGYGSHRALKQFTKYIRSSSHVLQCDICQYFPSIDLEILRTQIQNKIKCKETLWLIDLILENGHNQESWQSRHLDYFPGDTLLTPLERRRGLPIGNLTSQFLSNVYLNGLDHYVKEKLQIKKYIRYVDDFALFSDSHENLQTCRHEIENYLGKNLRLRIHPIKSQLSRTEHGGNFVGFRVLPDRIRVRNHNLRKGRRRLQQLTALYQQGRMNCQEIEKSLQSWDAHLQHGDTWRLRQNIFSHPAIPCSLRFL